MAYHKVPKKYLPLYVAEFQFRYNNLDNEDTFGARFGNAKKVLFGLMGVYALLMLAWQSSHILAAMS